MERAPDARVIIIGDTQVGKTTMLNRFVDKTYSPTTSSTVTPVFSPSQVETSSGKVVSLQLWDTAGQEKYQSVGKVFYRQANFAVICYDSSNNDPRNSITSWKESILSIEPSCKIFLASTKFDLVPSEDQLKVIELGTTLKAEFGALGFFATSALTGDGIDSLFTEVANEWYNQINSKQIKSGPRNQLANENRKDKSEKNGCC